MSEPLDRLLVLPELGDGGPTRVAVTLAGAWAAEGKRIAIATLFAGETPTRLPPGTTHVALATGGAPAPIEHSPGTPASAPRSRTEFRTAVAALRAAVLELRPALVLGFVDRANVAAVLACEGLDVPVLISERHDPVRNVLPAPWDRLRRRTYPRAALVTANTRAAIAALAGDVPPERLRWIPNPIVAPAAAPEPVRERSVLVVARLIPAKAHDVLLDAFARLADDLDDWRLVIVGRGPSEGTLRRRAATLGIAARVDWAGYVEDPAPWYARAGIFVLPSHHEGMPNALLEAMSAALPVVVTDGSPGPLEWIRDGENGLVVPVGAPAALAHAITRLARDPELRRRLGGRGREATHACALERVLADWDEAFAAVASSRSTSARALRKASRSEAASGSRT